MRWRSGLLTASSALLLAGCGGTHHAAPPPRPPPIPASVAARLAAEADHVATLAPGTCAARDAAARFRTDVMASIGRVPARYQEPLTSAANDLAERLASCAPPPAAPQQGEHGKHGEHGKKHGKKDDDEQGNEGGNG
jgi:hypothetical protein